jgi:SOS response regulatory protein OraA/RecX
VVEPSESALRVAVKALSRRELSTAELLARLGRAGIETDDAEAAVEHLREAGYLSDARAASERARVLAARPLGDAAITADLAHRGVPRDEIQVALDELTPETDRAQALVRRYGGGQPLARALRSKGFSGDTIETVLAAAVADRP